MRKTSPQPDERMSCSVKFHQAPELLQKLIQHPGGGEAIRADVIRQLMRSHSKKRRNTHQPSRHTSQRVDEASRNQQPTESCSSYQLKKNSRPPSKDRTSSASLRILRCRRSSIDGTAIPCHPSPTGVTNGRITSSKVTNKRKFMMKERDFGDCDDDLTYDPEQRITERKFWQR